MKNGKPHSIKYETDNLFTLHHVNAYEEDGHIIVDFAGYDDAEVSVLQKLVICILNLIDLNSS